jgi:hypothetical protein
LALVNQKLFKYVNNQSKYNINDERLTKSIANLLDSFIKIELFYNNFLFKNPESDINSNTNDITDSKYSTERMSNGINSEKINNNGIKIEYNNKNIVSNENFKNLNINNKESQKLMYPSNSNSILINDKKLNDSINDTNFNTSTDSININSYKNAILSDYIKTLKIGYLMPVDCGHNGSYNQAELDLYSFYLLNSNLLN